MNITLTASFWASAEKVLKHFPKAKSDIYDLIVSLNVNPQIGDPVPGYGGKIRKVRGQLKSYNAGKRGGLRVYYLFIGKTLVPFFIYTKKDMSDAPKETIDKLVALLLKEFPPPN
jgi:hypothetical protein